ncbi:MAG: thioredoxin domain-containing protein [Planctomycetota bacterium]|nr:thioredoxin domain-containing protein [Planctomycetota bacterium]
MTNRLAMETSPYLLQHASNPVHWYAWGQDALERARLEDKPIFLSIGYSACHWCHVMERESFCNESIAAILNEHFICIKVDREERPDLDHLYMEAVTALRGGQGGWPLSAFLTPSLDVFFGGTYWPPQPQQGMPGFGHVLLKVLEAFRERRSDVDKTADQLAQHLIQRQSGFRDDQTPLSMAILEQAACRLVELSDLERGGFGEAPKFPQAMELRLAWRIAHRKEHSSSPLGLQLSQWVRVSLDMMSRRGLYDHLGGGFARYSVDAEWRVPHFEKMLYDNALLLHIYLDVWLNLRREHDEVVIRETCDFLLDEMRNSEGGFLCAIDADSEGQEGRYYIWTADEIQRALSETFSEDAIQRFKRCYGVTDKGNFEQANVLCLTQDLEEFAAESGLTQAELLSELSQAKLLLLDARRKRVPPSKDAKVLTNWNGLAIEAVARAGRVFKEFRYVEAASQAAEFLMKHCQRCPGELLHGHCGGRATGTVFLDDYSHLLVAFLSLYEATLDCLWLERAEVLAEGMIRKFHDAEKGGFFYNENLHVERLNRIKEFHDASLPSGNATAAQGLQRLGGMIGKPEYQELAQETVRAGRALWGRHPEAASKMLVVLVACCESPTHWVLVPGDDATVNRAALRLLQARIPTEDYFAFGTEAEHRTGLLAHLFEGRTCQRGQPTLYICKNFTCAAPAVGLDAIQSAVEATRQSTSGAEL